MSGMNAIIAGAIYLLLGRFLVSRSRSHWQSVTFALLNLLGVYCFFIIGENKRFAAAFPIYIALVIFQYIVLRLFSGMRGNWYWLAFFTPILILVFCRYVPVTVLTSVNVFFNHILGRNFALRDFSFISNSFASLFVGLSYLAFRSSYLVVEVRNNRVKMPGFWEYLGFCFFLPTMAVGPINHFANHQSAFGVESPQIPVGRALLRIGVGYVKFKLLGTFFNQFGYYNLLLDDHQHHWPDLMVAAIFYYLYLYCDFSGFCDIAIGAAGVMGIPVTENFENPLAARNLKDFWNRWHITLSTWMRDIVFSPLSKYLVGLFGLANANHAIALTIMVVFLLIGIWHGVGLHYALFGLAQGLGVVVVHYYSNWLKRYLGRDGFKAYNENRWIQRAAVVVTFCYFAASLFFFANTEAEMRQIFQNLR